MAGVGSPINSHDRRKSKRYFTTTFCEAVVIIAVGLALVPKHGSSTCKNMYIKEISNIFVTIRSPCTDASHRVALPPPGTPWLPPQETVSNETACVPSSKNFTRPQTISWKTGFSAENEQVSFVYVLIRNSTYSIFQRLFFNTDFPLYSILFNKIDIFIIW